MAAHRLAEAVAVASFARMAARVKAVVIQYECSRASAISELEGAAIADVVVEATVVLVVSL